MINKNQIDIILPNYNKKQFLHKTINSVIAQTFKYWNLIIIDNNSTDGSKDILKEYQKISNIKIFYLKKNMGVAFSRNFGLRKSNSKYIGFLDSDDLWDKKKLQNQLHFMEKFDYSFTYTNYTPFLTRNNKDYFRTTIKPKEKYDLNSFVMDTSIATSSMIIKKDLINHYKFNNKSFNEDYDFKCKILKIPCMAYNLKENLTFYRITPGSRSSFKLKSLISVFKTNKNLLKLSFIKNIKSILFISFNSLRKYGYK